MAKTDDWVIIGNYRAAVAGPNATVPSLYNFYPTREAAEAKIAEHKAGFEKVGDVQKPFSLPYADETIQVVTFDEYIALKQKVMLSEPLREIEEDAFQEALDVLPPLKWETVDGVERFMLGEAFESTFYHQYAKKDGRFFARLANAADPTTWIGADEIDAFVSENTPTPAMR